MIRSFNSRIEFSDSPTGFYGFLRETFEKLAREEAAAAEWESLEPLDYPSFGSKDDSYEDVVKPFYAVWGGFSTKKSYAWKDKYRYSEAPDRRYRRAMEKENQRFRDEGKREFNDAVKTLVAFVKKRDPRHSTNAVSDADRLKGLRDAAAAQAARQRAENEAKMREHVVPEWAQAQTAEKEEEDESEEDEAEEEVFECVPCRKTFKSERQYDAHEKSKKHQKIVYALKKKMRKENEHLNLDAVSSGGLNTPATEESQEPADDSDAIGAVEDEAIDRLDNLDLVEDNIPVDSTIDRDKDKGSAPTTHLSPEEDEDLSDESGQEEAADESLAENLLPPSTLHDNTDDADSTTPQPPKLGKAAQKRAKKAAQAATAEQQELKFKCVTCNAGFPSKTRLFQHITDLKHAAPVQKAAKAAKGKKR
jgi:DnaJ homolog subfamily A member 5